MLSPGLCTPYFLNCVCQFKRVPLVAFSHALPTVISSSPLGHNTTCAYCHAMAINYAEDCKKCWHTRYMDIILGHCSRWLHHSTRNQCPFCEERKLMPHETQQSVLIITVCRPQQPSFAAFHRSAGTPLVSATRTRSGKLSTNLLPTFQPIRTAPSGPSRGSFSAISAFRSVACRHAGVMNARFTTARSIDA